MTRKAPEILEVTSQQLEELLERAGANTLRDEDTELMRSIFQSYAEFFQIVGDKNTTIARLRKMMFGATSETSKNVLGDTEDAPNPPPSDASAAASAASDHNQDEDSLESPPGHGRHGADAYPGADHPGGSQFRAEVGPVYMPISSPEEVAYRMGLIDSQQLTKLAAPLSKSGYGQYLLRLRDE